MGAMDGVTLTKKIRQDNEVVQIGFITGFADYISEGYEVSALHYLVKPVKLLAVGGEMLHLPVGQAQHHTEKMHNGKEPVKEFP